ncbi:hypothetical protein [Bacillus alkalicola]|nr:hypothetical protein [Bacillus alkalicola]
MLIKKAFHMNETKWRDLFKYWKGKGLYVVMILPYLITLVIIYPLSLLWFEWINFEYSTVGAITIILLLTLTGIFKFSKLEGMVLNRIQGN